MSLSHIGAILETQKLKPEFVKVFTDEFNFRSIAEEGKGLEKA